MYNLLNISSVSLPLKKLKKKNYIPVSDVFLCNHILPPGPYLKQAINYVIKQKSQTVKRVPLLNQHPVHSAVLGVNAGRSVCVRCHWMGSPCFYVQAEGRPTCSEAA